MKKISYYILSMGMGMLMLASCTDSFLDTSSKTSSNSTSFYKTQEQADYAVIGCYEMYQRTVSNGSWPSLFQAVETMSDDCLGGGGPDDRSDRLMDRFDRSYMSDQVDLFNGIWSDYYKCIYNCNQLINSIPDITFESDSDKVNTEAQARAIRGLAYFDLVRMFERVPLLTTATSDVVPQSEPDEVYNLIVSDLKYAADSMSASAYADKSTNLGRITKYAAGAMLARVYLFYDGVYNNNAGGEVPGGLTKAQALNYCEECIESGNYSLESDFANLWPAACTEATSMEEGRQTTYNEASDEIVWVVKFNNDQNWTSDNIDGNRFVVNLGLRNTTSYAPYGNGWGACPITPYAKTQFSSDDLRGDASIIDCSKLTDANGKTAYDTQIATDVMDYTGYVNKKYCPLIFTDGTSMPAAETDVTGGNMQTSQDQDWILIRYADVLLMAAELGSSNAMQYVNMVRERAYGNSDHDLTTAPTTQQIWNERRKEFMGEGIRYWDLRRQGLDAFVSAELGQAYSSGSNTGTPISVYNNTEKEQIGSTYQEDNIRSKRGFFQIPKTQIDLSGGIYQQNAGWD
jgi:hypothetical protein